MTDQAIRDLRRAIMLRHRDVFVMDDDGQLLPEPPPQEALTKREPRSLSAITGVVCIHCHGMMIADDTCLQWFCRRCEFSLTNQQIKYARLRIRGS